jgi:hypothetical protein
VCVEGWCCGGDEGEVAGPLELVAVAGGFASNAAVDVAVVDDAEHPEHPRSPLAVARGDDRAEVGNGQERVRWDLGQDPARLRLLPAESPGEQTGARELVNAEVSQVVEQVDRLRLAGGRGTDEHQPERLFVGEGLGDAGREYRSDERVFGFGRLASQRRSRPWR